MSLWFILAMMTAAAAFAVLWPLARPRELAEGSDLAVYRNQLSELERDRRSGALGQAEAEAAKLEIGRRLLAADAGRALPLVAPSGPARRRIVSGIVLLALPLAAAGLYWQLGSPALPGAPIAARLSAPVEARPLDTLVAQVEAHLEANPDDGRGWEVLAPVYLRLGRYDDAIKARRAALRFNGATAAREADLGEALIYRANGIVTAEAKEAFQRALALDGKEHKARYFLGLALEQDGKPAEALALWRAMIAEAPASAPWLETVRRAIARVAPEGPSGEDVLAAETMPPEERNAMVRGMVERLAARLAQDGNDAEGWLRLIRAYTVLQEPEKARAAAGDARRTLKDDAPALKRIDDLLKLLGLET